MGRHVLAIGAIAIALAILFKMNAPGPNEGGNQQYTAKQQDMLFRAMRAKIHEAESRGDWEGAEIWRGYCRRDTGRHC